MDLKALHAPSTGGLTKTLRIMKLTAIILLSACLTASANGFSQKVTLSEKNARLEKVFTTIKQQTGFEFLYTYEMLQKAERITIDLKSVELEDALNIIFKDQPLTFSIIEKTVVVKPKTTQPIKAELPLPISVRGKVVNENGDPVRATITVKGTNNAVSTNDNGEFLIDNVDENATLIITSTSIETPVEIKVNRRVNVGEVITATKIAEGGEVVLKTNYWEVKQKDNPGNISRVTAATIEKQPIQNPLQALQGRVAGLQISQNTGIPGSGFSVQLRGLNSIPDANKPPTLNNPLYVVDGVPFPSQTLSSTSVGSSLFGVNSSSGFSPLNSINPADIESIEILKDADATAIYGSRGANGVIVITTKRGKSGKLKIDLNFESGISKMTRRVDLLSREEYLMMRYEAYANDGINWRLSSVTNANDLKVWDTTRYTDWQDELLGGSAGFTRTTLSVSGGSQNTQFLFSGSYNKQGVVFPGTEDQAAKQGSMLFSVAQYSSNRRLKTQFSANYVVNTSDLLYGDITQQALTLPPVAPALYDQQGNINWENSTWNNPLLYTIGSYKLKSTSLITNNITSYDFPFGLTLKVSGGFSNLQQNDKELYPNTMNRPSLGTTPANSGVRTNSTSFQSWIIEPQAAFSKKVRNGDFAFVLGASFQQDIREQLTQTFEGFSSNSLMNDIRSAATKSVGSYDKYEYVYNALFGRINYNLKGKYIANLSARRDGSSRFGPGKQFANFGAVGLAWVFSKEPWVEKGLSFLSFGKLRMSYGQAGNDNIGDYRYLDVYGSFSSYQGVTGLVPARLFNPNYAWEVNNKFETGLELNFLNDRIKFIVSYYRNRSSNQLVQTPLPSTTGFASILNNLPATVQNAGLEFEISANNIKKASLSWTTEINLSINRNKLISFPGLAGSTYSSTYVVGEPISISKRYQANGIDPQTGLYNIVDLNGDGTISTLDRLLISNFTTPKYYGGIGNSLTYRNFQFDIFFQFVSQHGVFLTNWTSQPGQASNQPAIVLDRWRKIGDNSSYQRFSTISGSTSATAYSRFSSSGSTVIDASFVRLKNLSISYIISSSSKYLARVFIQGQNLLTITKYPGLDPENGTGSLPPLMTIIAGFKFSF